MKSVIAREGREAKNLLLYHLSSEDDLTQSKYAITFGSVRRGHSSDLFCLFLCRTDCQEATFDEIQPAEVVAIAIVK